SRLTVLVADCVRAISSIQKRRSELAGGLGGRIAATGAQSGSDLATDRAVVVNLNAGDGAVIVGEPDTALGHRRHAYAASCLASTSRSNSEGLTSKNAASLPSVATCAPCPCSSRPIVRPDTPALAASCSRVR